MANIHRLRKHRMQRVAKRSHSARRLRGRLFLASLGILAITVVVSVGTAGLFVYRSYANDLVPPTELIASTGTGSSVAVDRNGRFLFEFLDPLAGLRDPVPLEDVSPYLIGATIATEDASFYDNPGINVQGLVRAVRENLPTYLGGQGFGEGSGGSSITQQLVKNVYIEQEERFDRRLERKVKETVLAIELRRRYSADQILEWYLNQIDYGNFAHGIQAAANRYFGKSASDLTLAESAMLAGIPQAPTLFTPVLPENKEAAVQRQHEVLARMMDEGYISSSQAAEARAQPLESPLDYGSFQLKTAIFDINAPHFVFHVEEVLRKMCAKEMFRPPGNLNCDEMLGQGVLTVVTSLDLELQRIGEQVLEETLRENEATTGGHNGSIVAIDPNNGEVLAMVGSRNFFDEEIQGQVDIVTSLRSHGSTMKVFTYLTAFEQGWVPSTLVDDSQLILEDLEGSHEINNWNFSHLGEITVRRALTESVNVPAVRTVIELSEDDVKRTIHRLGITDIPQGRFCGNTITLGSCEVKALDMAFAYATIANNGVMKGMPTVEDLPEGLRDLDPVSVLQIRDQEGNIIYEYQGPQERSVIDSAYPYMITHILSNDAIRWSQLSLPFPAAAKTGTSEEFRDSVVLGYTPDLSVGVWMGNADGTVMADRTFSGSGAGPMWNMFMRRASEHLELAGRGFSVPDSIVVSECGQDPDGDDGPSGPSSEIFVEEEPLRKPGACRAPGQDDPLFPSKPPVRPSVTTPTPRPLSPPLDDPAP